MRLGVEGGAEGSATIDAFSLLFTALGTFLEGPFTLFFDKYQNDDRVPASYLFDSPLGSHFFFRYRQHAGITRNSILDSILHPFSISQFGPARLSRSSPDADHFLHQRYMVELISMYVEVWGKRKRRAAHASGSICCDMVSRDYLNELEARSSEWIGRRGIVDYGVSNR